MNVLLINGSPRANGNTFLALTEVARTLGEEGIGSRIIQLGTKAVQGCIACNRCAQLGRCVFHDALYEEVREAVGQADGLIVGSPVYYAGPNGSLCALLDRIFYTCSAQLAYKPAAAVVACRRGGASATFDRLNKYFTINNMPVVSSQYWNSIHGRLPGEAAQDAEGLQTMRVLARNMARLLKAAPLRRGASAAGGVDRHELHPLTASLTGCRAVGRRACGRRRTVGVCRAVIFGGQAVGSSGDELAPAGRRTIGPSDRTDGYFCPAGASPGLVRKRGRVAPNGATLPLVLRKEGDSNP